VEEDSPMNCRSFVSSMAQEGCISAGQSRVVRFSENFLSAEYSRKSNILNFWFIITGGGLRNLQE